MPNRPADALVVHEIFASIQGESSFAGLPCTFVRLSGCNLCCSWCDTPEARAGGREMSLADVVAQALAGGTDLIEVTGGEPLLQAGTLALLRTLCDAERTVLLETNGTQDLSSVDPRVHRIVDVKTPSSGCADAAALERLRPLGERDEIKFVLAHREDYEWMRRRLNDGAFPRGPAVLVSCVFGVLEPAELVRWILADGLRVRVQLQLHKLIWGPAARGV